MKKLQRLLFLALLFSASAFAYNPNLPVLDTNRLPNESTIIGVPTSGVGFGSVKVSTDGGLIINQNTVVDALNSTTANLAAGATFTGSAVPDLNYTAVQYIISASQDCAVYVDQSPDGVNWDISDQFAFHAPTGNGNTIQLVASYYRVRVTNTSATATTFLRLQVIDVPFLASLPRSLDNDGHLQTHTYGFQDSYATEQHLAPNGEVIAVPLYKLAGDVFTGNPLDTNFWTPSLGTGGSAVVASGELTISTGTTANNAVEVTSVRTARYSGLAPNKFRTVVQLPDAGVVNNVRHWGVGTISGTSIQNGAVFKMNGTSLELDTYRSGVEAPITNGNFNGQWGRNFNPGLTSHFYEIIYQPRQVIWFADNKIIHTLTANTAPWTDEIHLPIHFGNYNINGSTTNVSMSVRHGTVARFGIPDIQPTSNFVVGLNAGLNLKNSPGNLHGIVLSGITNNAVITLYDSLTATGKVIWTSGPLTANGLPFFIDTKRIPFSIGLTVAITGANTNVLVMYE